MEGRSAKVQAGWRANSQGGRGRCPRGATAGPLHSEVGGREQSGHLGRVTDLGKEAQQRPAQPGTPFFPPSDLHASSWDLPLVKLRRQGRPLTSPEKAFTGQFLGLLQPSTPHRGLENGDGLCPCLPLRPPSAGGRLLPSFPFCDFLTSPGSPRGPGFYSPHTRVHDGPLAGLLVGIPPFQFTLPIQDGFYQLLRK